MIHHQDDWLTVYGGDARDVLPTLPAASVHCVVTSPPYWGLRDYGSDGQLGLEATPEEYVANLVAVFREVRRVLRDDGTVWLNLGDSYAGARSEGDSRMAGFNERYFGKPFDGEKQRETAEGKPARAAVASLKPKDLVGIPWRVAFALQQPFYAGTIKDERDRVWLAAMLDAEGCLFIHKRKAGQHNGQGYYRTNDSFGAGMEIANTSEAIVKRCQEIAGGRGSIFLHEKARRQPLYRWSMRSNECRDVVRELYPHLVGKQHQARLLLACPSSGPDAEKAHASMIELHNGRPATIDFKPPESLFEPGWYLRSDIVWSKSNPMPESVTDRPTKAHEMVFLLTKEPRYYFDQEAVREKVSPWNTGTVSVAPHDGNAGRVLKEGHRKNEWRTIKGANLRSVWTIATRPYPGAHFAVFPPELPERCIKAGTSERGVCPGCGAPWNRSLEVTRSFESGSGRAGHLPEGKNGKAMQGGGETLDVRRGPTLHTRTLTWIPGCHHGLDPVPAIVLDPFAGSGTVGVVANRLSRRAILIDLNPAYLEQQMRRNAQVPVGL